MEEEKSKGKKPRLRSIKAILAETIQQLNDIVNDKEMAPSKRANAVFQKADLLSTMVSTASEETRNKLKHSSEAALTQEVEQLRKENAELRVRQVVPIARPDESFEDKLKRHGIEKESHV